MHQPSNEATMSDLADRQDQQQNTRDEWPYSCGFLAAFLVGCSSATRFAWKPAFQLRASGCQSCWTEPRWFARPTEHGARGLNESVRPARARTVKASARPVSGACAAWRCGRADA